MLRIQLAYGGAVSPPNADVRRFANARNAGPVRRLGVDPNTQRNGIVTDRSPGFTTRYDSPRRDPRDQGRARKPIVTLLEERSRTGTEKQERTPLDSEIVRDRRLDERSRVRIR